MRRLFIPVFAVVLSSWCASARADFADDLARVHTEAVGGRQRLLELKSLRASGVTEIQGKTLHFVMWAERPNRVRTETTSGGRVLTQGYDGVNPPWILDSKTGKVLEMNAVDARDFSAEADFDDPLVLRKGRSITLDYAGEATVDGKAAFKLLVTENLTETSFVYLDRATCFLIRREVSKVGPQGRETVETDYRDFAPVNGVMLPHRIVEKAAGKVRYETRLERIEANPAIMPGLFSKPAGTAGR